MSTTSGLRPVVKPGELSLLPQACKLLTEAGRGWGMFPTPALPFWR
jgi:hypothetical protein